MEIDKRNASLRESLLALLLLLITISVMIGPLFLLFYKPSVLLKSDRLEEYVSITSYLTAFFSSSCRLYGSFKSIHRPGEKGFYCIDFLMANSSFLKSYLSDITNQYTI